MKKMIAFILIPCVLLIILLSIFQYQFQNAEYQLISKKGNANILDALNIKASYGITDTKVIDYELKKGTTSYDVERKISEKNHPEINQRILYFSPDIEYAKTKDNYDGNPYTRKDAYASSSSCNEKPTHQKVKGGTISYNFGVSGNKQEDFIESNERIKMFTMQSDHKRYLVEEKYPKCDDLMYNTNIFIEAYDKEQGTFDRMADESSYIYYDDDTFFFLPKKYEQFTGDLQIYKIKVKEVATKQQQKKKSTLDIKPIITLKENRNNYRMKALQERKQFVVLSNDTKQIYLTFYDLEGKQLAEKVLPLTVMNLENIELLNGNMSDYEYFFVNNQYLTWYQKEHMYVFDMDKLELIEQIKTKNAFSSSILSDIYYKDGITYALSYRDKGIISIQAWKNEQLIYQGEWSIAPEKGQVKEDMMDYVYGSFVLVFPAKVVR